MNDPKPDHISGEPPPRLQCRLPACGADEELRVTVPTYVGQRDHLLGKRNTVSDYDETQVPVLIHPADGLRIVLGSHDLNDYSVPDIQIERRPKGWAIFLHPVGGDDASGIVYFTDVGKSYLMHNLPNGFDGNVELIDQEAEIPDLDI